MDDPRTGTPNDEDVGNIASVAQWRDARNNPNYLQEADRQARSAAHADVEDRVMEWCEGIAAEAWDDL